MKKDSTSLWSPNEEARMNSKLELFCRDLDKKKFLKYNRSFKYLWKWSVEKPETFWSEVSNEIFWYKKPKKIHS